MICQDNLVFPHSRISVSNCSRSPVDFYFSLSTVIRAAHRRQGYERSLCSRIFCIRVIMTPTLILISCENAHNLADIDL